MNTRPPVMTNRLRTLALAAVFCMAPLVAHAQRAAIQGIVTSSETIAPLEGAAVMLETGGRQLYAVFTDRNGFYHIGGIAPGTYTLKLRMLGYREHDQAVTLAAGERAVLSLRVEPSAVVLDRIVVTPERGAAVRDLGRQRVTAADVRLVPTPAGSGDIASYLQTLPGVTTTGDRGGQLFVRGGTPAENLVLVDGIPIYQPFHILGFFSVFPEDLVSSADFYASGFGARYQGRTSSVLDVRLRDGDPNDFRAMASISPFIAEALIEGPWKGGGATWLASVRRSLVEETSGPLLGMTHPLTFESQLIKLRSVNESNNHCAALALRTADRGRIDPGDKQSRVEWNNLLGGLRCVTMRGEQLLDVNFSFTKSGSAAVSRGSSQLRSDIWRVHHDMHATTHVGSRPLNAGYFTYLEGMNYDLTELYGMQTNDEAILGAGAYVETELSAGGRLMARPGLVATLSPRPALEPRVRASWQPFGRPTEVLQGAFGLYRQNAVGTSDTRDVGSVFMAWTTAPEDKAMKALHGTLGWQQTIGPLQFSVDGFYKHLQDVPVPAWSGVVRFNTTLGRADGEVYGADTRLEFSKDRFYGFLGYGYTWTRYTATQDEFSTWFGSPVQQYHPPHDRRHQLNALTSFEIAGFKASARWQFGSGLPFTRPMGFDEAFDYTKDLHDVHTNPGTPRLLLDRPYTARLPLMHRLDVSIERGFDLSPGRLTVQAGVVNAYDRRNMFYYDLYTARRVDQLPLAPFLSVSLRPDDGRRTLGSR